MATAANQAGERTQKEINWNASRFEFELMSKIATRAVKMAAALGVEYSMSTAIMDINACHSNGCPLFLDELLKSDNSNFGHDVFGIRRHINRETGQLEGCFLPRFAMPTPATL